MTLAFIFNERKLIVKLLINVKVKIMKFFVGAFWALLFGEIIGYIGQALQGGTYSPMFIGIWSIIIGLLGTMLFSSISKSANKN